MTNMWNVLGTVIFIVTVMGWALVGIWRTDPDTKVKTYCKFFGNELERVINCCDNCGYCDTVTQ